MLQDKIQMRSRGMGNAKGSDYMDNMMVVYISASKP